MNRALACIAVVTVLGAPVAAGPGDATTGSQAAAIGSEGRCRMAVTELQSRVRVRFVMRTNMAGRTWRFRIFDEGRRVFRDAYRTDADGDFVVRELVRRRPGYRRYEGRASEVGTGVVCSVVLRT